MAEEKSSEKRLSLDEDQITAIRHALLIGLESFGEIERLQNVVEVNKISQKQTPVQPLHPTGAADTIGDFAAALRYLEGATEVADE